jgi:hypothetical protein
MEKMMTLEDIKKMYERFKNSKNPLIKRMLPMIEAKIKELENAKAKEV